jgi:SAM-dependent methyltransferase
MGRFSEPLAEKFAAFAGVASGDRALDVGCGPGALTRRLVDLLGAGQVTAIDPSAPFVEATRQRCPGVDVMVGTAEELPFDEGVFDAALAQLVVHFMRDPVAGMARMARVTRIGGTVAACVWDHAGGSGPLSPFWDVVHQLDPDAGDESTLAGVREGDLVRIARDAGLADRIEDRLSVVVDYPSFDVWWEPYTLGVGPAGDYLRGLDGEQTERIRRACADRLGSGPFSITATAWAVRATRS